MFLEWGASACRRTRTRSASTWIAAHIGGACRNHRTRSSAATSPIRGTSAIRCSPRISRTQSRGRSIATEFRPAGWRMAGWFFISNEFLRGVAIGAWRSPREDPEDRNCGRDVDLLTDVGDDSLYGVSPSRTAARASSYRSSRGVAPGRRHRQILVPLRPCRRPASPVAAMESSGGLV